MKVYHPSVRVFLNAGTPVFAAELAFGQGRGFCPESNPGSVDRVKYYATEKEAVDRATELCKSIRFKENQGGDA